LWAKYEDVERFVVEKSLPSFNDYGDSAVTCSVIRSRYAAFVSGQRLVVIDGAPA